MNEFVRIFNGTRYLVLFEPEKYDALYNRIRYLEEMLCQKSDIAYAISYNHARIKIDSYDY